MPLDFPPDYVGEAFVAVEGRRFYRHHDVDLRRIVGAALADAHLTTPAQRHR